MVLGLQSLYPLYDELYIFFIIIVSYMSVTFHVTIHSLGWFLDIYMDGQLGVDSENSLVPIFLDEFLGLVSPRSLENQSDSERKTQLKV